jgi:hypothetical protein
MREFVDLRGASGTLYRFRLWPEGGAHPPIAGNYIVLREEASGLKILLAGVTSDLSQAAAESRKALAKDPAARLYTRLNVARALRSSEHEDIVAEHRPVTVSAGDQ